MDQNSTLEYLFSDLDSYNQLDVEDKGKLPKKPGVYILFTAKQCLYVGQTNNLKSRWSSHSQLTGVECRYPKWYLACNSRR